MRTSTTRWRHASAPLRRPRRVLPILSAPSPRQGEGSANQRQCGRLWKRSRGEGEGADTGHTVAAARKEIQLGDAKLEAQSRRRRRSIVTRPTPSRLRVAGSGTAVTSVLSLIAGITLFEVSPPSSPSTSRNAPCANATFPLL